MKVKRTKTKRTKKKNTTLTKRVKKAVKKITRKLRRPKLRLEIDAATSMVSAANALGFKLRPQVFIKDNVKKRLLNGPLDFDHAVAIIDHYNRNKKKKLPEWLTRT